MSKGKLQRTTKPSESFAALVLSQDGKILASVDANKRLTAEILGAHKPLSRRIERSVSVTTLAVASGPASFAYGQGKDIRVEPLDGAGPVISLSGQHRLAVTALTFAPDGKRLVSGDANGVVII